MSDHIKSFCFSPGGRHCPLRTWVLIIHHEFKGYDDHRFGNEADINNLRDTFGRRNCVVRDLASRRKDKILSVLREQDKLFSLFDENDSRPPEVFVIFILSHGTSAGIIETDHLVEGNEKGQVFETYHQEDVWNGLKGMKILQKCTKLIFFGPCRGINQELSLPLHEQCKNLSYQQEQILPKWIATPPNQENMIVFYATVESTKAQRNSNGTWIVIELCRELNTMTDDVSLPIFLTRVQKRICERTTIESIYGQTPQLQIFNHTELRVDSHPLNESKDGRSGDLEKTVKYERKDFYQWRSNSSLLYRRGRALIFHDVNHTNWSREAEKSFQFLDFETTSYSFKQLKIILTNVSRANDCGLQEEGCFLVCIMAKLIDSKSDGLAVICDGDKLPLDSLIQMFTGHNCPELIGKPKLFFFLSNGGQEDDRLIGEVPKDWVIRGNNHGEIFTFLGIGGPENQHDLIKSLLAELQNPKLKKGLSLQEAVISVVQKCTPRREECILQILPQISSTLHYLLDFTPCKNTYIKPTFKIEGYTETKTFDDLVQDISQTVKSPEEKWKNRTWLVSASAGMGKSAATKEMCKNLTDLLPDHLVVNIALTKMCKYFLRVKKNASDQGNTCDFLSEALVKRDYEVDSLSEKIAQKKIVLFMDGYDAVWAYEEIVLKIIMEMNALDICQWITTRPHQQSKIIANLSKINFLEINPMTKVQQIQLLKTVLYKNAKECEGLLKIFEKIADKVVDTEGSATSLYYQFVFSKVDSAILKHNGTDATKPGYMNTVRDSIELLMMAAANYFYGENLPSQHLKLSPRKQNEINKLGIASIEFEGKKLQSIYFVHQTYAEYLLSLFFLSKAGHFTEQHESYLDKIEENEINLSDILLRSEFEQVRSFIDGFFIGADFESKFRKTKLDDCCEKADFQNKSHALMAYVCKEGLARLFNILFESEYKNNFGDITALINTPFTFNFRKKEYKYYPLYAACYSNEELALHLIDLGAKIELLDPKKCLVEGNETIMHLAAKRGLSRIMKKLLEFYPQMKNVEKSDGKTPIDVAAERGFMQCVNILLDATEPEKRILMRKRAMNLAAIQGHTDVVFNLMGDDLKTDLYDKSPLFHAACYGHILLIRALIYSGIDVNIEDPRGSTPVHATCVFGRYEALKVLHEYGAILNKKTKNTLAEPIHIACSRSQSGRKDILDFLFKNGVDVDAKDHADETPYHKAAAVGLIDVLKNLEEAGANVYATSKQQECVDNDGKKFILGKLTALDRAAISPDPSAVCTRHLLQHNYPLELKKHALWLAIVAPIATYNNLEHKLGAFLDNGIQINEELVDGKNALILLAEKSGEFNKRLPGCNLRTIDDEEIEKEAPFHPRPSDMTIRETFLEPNWFSLCIKVLINRGADINLQSKYFGGALHIAAKSGDIELIRLLLKNKAFVNLRNDEKQTPLHTAAKYGRLRVVESILLKPGIEINALDENNYTPLALAISKRQKAVAKYLLSNGADAGLPRKPAESRPIAVAASTDQKDFVQLILDTVPMERKQMHLDTALRGAIFDDNVKMVKYLIQKGADPTSGNIVCFPLLYAIKKLSYNSARTIIGQFDNEYKDRETASALIQSVSQNDLSGVELLLEEGVNVNKANSKGLSAMLIATIYGFEDIVDYLLKFDELDLITPSKDGNVPLLFIGNIKCLTIKEKLHSRILQQLEEKSKKS
ncbi:uncharacterized protein LOC132193227 isoform X2 [Neocloeon triangulifer]|uniref:uncharacterized protein LOC132193227 isoform X2 n=1 Tax=Neocloeon triangulifer TaxID=2078957 RepID=UPI00286EF8CD|nr:uncharacterized protein LOC132193227 isoform X2 [Neocloeon triangulifer]